MVAVSAAVGALVVGRPVALTAVYLAHMVAAAFAGAVKVVAAAAAAAAVGVEGSIGAASLVEARDGVQPAYHERHEGCRLVGWAYMHIR